MLVPGTTNLNWSSIAGDSNNTNLVATVDGGQVRVGGQSLMMMIGQGR